MDDTLPARTLLASVEASTVRLLTYNLGLNRVRLAGRWKLPVASRPDRRLITAPGRLQALGADVLALQEVYDPQDKRHLADALAPTHPYSFASRGRRSLFGSGLMFLSRFPIRSGAFIPCRNPFLAARLLWESGFLAVEIELPAIGPTRFVNVHLAAGVPFHHPEAPATTRHRSYEIAALITAALHCDPPALLVGDFNTSPEICPENYCQIIAAGYVDTFLAVQWSAEGEKAFTWDATNPLARAGWHKDSPSQRIDHVFLPKARTPTLAPLAAKIVLREPVVRLGPGRCSPLSDHYGLLATLSIAPDVFDSD